MYPIDLLCGSFSRFILQVFLHATHQNLKLILPQAKIQEIIVLVYSVVMGPYSTEMEYLKHEKAYMSLLLK